MEAHLIKAPQQISQALAQRDLVLSCLKTQKKNVQQVLLMGMGGSSIGGKVVFQWIQSHLSIPCHTLEGDLLPAWVGPQTLLLLVSYSGNTQETLQVCDQALAKKAQIVCLTVGGKLKEKAHKQNLSWIPLPAGMPPRASLPAMVILQLWILWGYDLVSDFFVAPCQEATNLLVTQQAPIRQKAQAMAQALADRLPIIYTSDIYAPVALRLQQQCQENAKQLCWHQVYPALYHNEVAAWQGKQFDKAVIYLTDNVLRHDTKIEKLHNYIIDTGAYWLPWIAEGKNHLVRTWYLLHSCDWLSYYLALVRGIDPLPIPKIEALKQVAPK